YCWLLKWSVPPATAAAWSDGQARCQRADRGRAVAPTGRLSARALLHWRQTGSDARRLAVSAVPGTEQSEQPEVAQRDPRGSALEVLLAATRLGLTSFGGPIAHLGYFRAEYVERRRWVDEQTYADLVALCQFLPGPASSQLGIAL